MKAICVGINNFRYHPKSSLYGCVNDAHDMAGFFQTRGVTDITILAEEQATHEAVTDAIIDAVESGAESADPGITINRISIWR